MASVRDIGERLPGIAALRQAQQGGAASQPEYDPVHEALKDRRAILGDRIREQAMSEAEAEAETQRAEAETRRAQAQLDREIALAKLAELQRPQPGGGSQDILLAMIEMFKGDRQQAQSEVSELRQQLMATIQESNQRVIQALSEANRADPQAPMAQQFIQAIAELKDVRGALSELSPTPDVTATARSIDEAIQLQKLREDHEARMAQLSHERWLAQQRLELEREERIATARARESAARSFESVAPTIVQAFATRVLGMPAAEGGAPAAGAPAMQQAKCPNCQNVMEFPAGSADTICSKCGARWDLGPAETPPPGQLPGPDDEEPGGPESNGNGHDGRFQPPSMFFS